MICYCFCVFFIFVQKRNMQSAVVPGVIVISNLLPHVTSEDVRKIFNSVGNVTQAFINYNGKNGNSTGTGEVHYAVGNHAKKAYQVLQNATIDGQAVRIRLKTRVGAGQGRGRGNRKNFNQRGGRRNN